MKCRPSRPAVTEDTEEEQVTTATVTIRIPPSRPVAHRAAMLNPSTDTLLHSSRHTARHSSRAMNTTNKALITVSPTAPILLHPRPPPPATDRCPKPSQQATLLELEAQLVPTLTRCRA